MAVGLPPPAPRAPIGQITPNPLPNQPPQVNVSEPWAIYFRDQRQYLAQLPVNVAPSVLPLVNQNAAVATTTIFNVAQAGLYSFEYALPIRVIDPVSATATPSIAWTDTGTKTHAFSATDGTSITTPGSGRWLFYAQPGPITYAIAYASNTANLMEFDFFPLVSAVATVAS